MTIEDIFTKICTHMAEGIQYHDEMKKAYSFLGFFGYSAEQEKHYNEELQNYNKLIKYYMMHYFKLLKIDDIPKPTIIPETWYKYSAQAVDIATKRKSIKELMTKWIQWEKDTKKLYEEMYYELTNLREVAAIIKIEKLIKDVDEELSEAEQQLLNLEAIGYDLTLIIDWQSKLQKKYRDKT